MSKYKLTPSTGFRKDYKKIKRNPTKLALLEACFEILSENGREGIPKKMVPHKLKGGYAGGYECHIQPDLLLIWEQLDEPDNEILLLRVGSHSDLF